jgi:hypothetical protein
MSPEVASEKARTLDGAPKASLVGWQVITEPDTSDAEAWTVYANLPPGLVHEERLLYLRSDSTGEVISSGLPELAGSRISMVDHSATLAISLTTLKIT